MIPWIVAAVAALAAIGLLIRMATLIGETNKLSTERTELRRENKKLTDKLDDQQTKYSQAAQAASTKSERARDSKARVGQLQDELSKTRAENTRLEERVKELAQDLSRVRIDREQTRQELSAARDRLKQLGQTAAELEAMRAAAARTPVADAPAPSPVAAAPAPGPSNRELTREKERLERDIEAARQAVDRMEAALQRMKKRAVEREYELRKTEAKNEHNRRAYIITQLQLNLLTDENYFLKHGKHPDHRLAEKAAKRQALKPEPERIEVDRSAEPIVLPGNEPKPRPVTEAEPEELDAEAMLEPGYDDEPDASETQAAPAPKAAAPAPKAAEPAPKAAEAAPVAASPATDAAPAQGTGAKLPPPPKAEEKTTFLRKSKENADATEPATEARETKESAEASGRPPAPPRPKAPPRPS